MEITYQDYLKEIGESVVGERPEFTAEYIRTHICIDSEYEVYDGNEYVNFALHSTDALCEIADDIRIEKGMIPFFKTNDEGDIDEGWYDFYLIFYKSGKVGLYFSVDADKSTGDNYKDYTILLTEEEQQTIYEELKSEIRNLTYYAIWKDGNTFYWRDTYED